MITFYTYIQSFNLETIYFFSAFLLASIAKLLPFELEPFSLFKYFSSLIFFFSISYLLKARSEFSLFHSLILGAFSTLSIIYVGAGFLPVVVFFPLILLLSLRQYSAQEKSSVLYFALIVLEITVYFAANVLAFFYYAISRIFYPTNLTGSLGKVRETSLAFISFYIFFYFSQLCQVFDYPKNARLFDINSIQQMGEVIFGTERIPFTLLPEIFVDERIAALEFTLLLILPLLLLIFYGLKRDNFKLKDGVIYLIFILFLTVFSTSFFNPDNFIFSPEGILYSIFPGLIWRVYPWFFILLFLILLIIYFAANSKPSIKATLAYSLYLIFVICFVERPFQEVFITTGKISEIDLRHTPSSYLLKQYELTANSLPKGDDHYQEILELGSLCTISANRNQDEIENALDNNIETVWRTQGRQKIGDSITIICNKDINFDRILLSSGANGSDFPRGFQIEVGDNIDNLRLSKKLPLWMGKVEMTASNLPYFGPQHEEYVDFDRRQSAKVIKITLLRGSDVFDWSVAEIKFFRFRNPENI